MPNYAYLSFWFENSTPQALLEQFGKLLALFPVSPAEPGFRALVIQAVDSAQPPLFEREFAPSATAVRSLATDFMQPDCACELRAYWDLWRYQLQGPRLLWQEAPSPVEFALHGEEYGEGVFAESGHVLITLGFEHLFTGHADILSGSGAESEPEQFVHRAEYEFALALQEPESLETYRTKTRENIRRLLAFERAIWKQLCIARRCLWSEGEANFQQRLEQVLIGPASK